MHKRIPLFLGLLLTFFAAWMLLTSTKFIRNTMERLENLGYDLQLRAYVIGHNEIPADVVAIVDIDDASLKAEGRWPWSRGTLAKLVTELQKQGVAIIAFDVFLSESEPNIAESVLNKLQQQNKVNPLVATELKKNIPDFDEDKELADVLSQNQVVLALGFLSRDQTQNTLPSPLLTLTPQETADLDIIEAQGYISSIPVLQNAAKGGGFINIYGDMDGIIRHAPLLVEYKRGIYPSLALQAVLLYLGQEAKLITPNYGKSIKLEGIQIGGQIIPTDAKGQVLIPFIGRSYTFPYYSATNVLHGQIPKDALLGKIVFIGTSATGLGDLKATAIQNPFPGVEIQASLANGLLVNNFSYKPAWTFGANLVITILFGLISTFIFPYFGPRLLSLIIILLPPVLLYLNNWLWFETGLILSFILPVVLVLVIALLNMIYGYLFETRKRERLKEMFGQYVPEKHIDEMLLSTGGYALRGEDREMSVLFADIRNFTTISEEMPAAELVEMLNAIFTPMTEIIFKHRGTIDKYVGDLIMAFWSAPLKDKFHARHAIQSAIDMQARIISMKKMIADKNWPEIQIGIGINSGMMSVGDMGSKYRRNYTVVGDAVNLASRAEGLSKYYGVDILVTESTQHDQPKFIFRKLDRVIVKGKKHGIDIYEVIGNKLDLTPELQQELDTYHRALDLYFQQRWEEALTLMTELHKAHSDKKIYLLYMIRIDEFIKQPPPENWDGIYAHINK